MEELAVYTGIPVTLLCWADSSGEIKQQAA